MTREKLLSVLLWFSVTGCGVGLVGYLIEVRSDIGRVYLSRKVSDLERRVAALERRK